MYSINFLENRRKKLTKLERQDRQAFKITAIVFGVICGITLLLLGGRIFFDQQKKAVADQQKQLENQVLSQEDTEEAFLFFINKLDSLEKLFAERKDKQAAIKYFSEIFGPEVLVQNIAYNSRESSITFGLQAKDVFTLESVFNALASDQTKQQFQQVSKSDLRRMSDGMYTVRVVVSFAKPEEPAKTAPKPAASGAAKETETPE